MDRGAGPVPGEAANGWPGAFRALAAALPDSPSIVVLDGYPWLAERDATFDGALQAAWDRLLSQRPVLLLLGSGAYMRFYLEIGRAVQERARRGRPASAVALLRRHWSSWRLRAVKPVIREALSCAADVLPWPEAVAVGGWWTRTFETSIDIVGADRSPGARTVFYAGSILWLSRPFDDRDLGVLRRDAPFVPGFDPASAGLVAVSLRGFSATTAARLALCWGPEEVIAAYRA